VTLNVEVKNRFGCKYPVFNLNLPEYKLGFAPAMAPLAAGNLQKLVVESFPKLVHLSQIEKQLEMLAAEIEKTRRRVNALEYNLIPALQEACKSIIMKLEERDRSERTVLMKVKELIEAK